jgi:cell division protein ZapA
MTNKNDTKVLIGGNVYTLSGYESEEYIQRVALYINNKMEEMKESVNGKQLNTRLFSVLLALNVADDLFKEREKNEEAHKLLNLKEEQIGNLEEEMLEQQILIDELKGQVAKLEAYKQLNG